MNFCYIARLSLKAVMDEELYSYPLSVSHTKHQVFNELLAAPSV